MYHQGTFLASNCYHDLQIWEGQQRWKKVETGY